MDEGPLVLQLVGYGGACVVVAVYGVSVLQVIMCNGTHANAADTEKIDGHLL